MSPPPVRTPAAADDPDRAALERTWRRRPGLAGWITTTDHKEIGLRIIVTALGFFALGGLLAAAMRLQLSRPLNTVLGPDAYDQAFTTHGTSMMFLFAVPIMQGFGIYLVPLMVGTRNVAFPRLINFAYWVYLIAGLMLYGGLILGMGPDMGWFSYVPLAGPQFGPGHRVDLWSQMVTLVETSTLCNAIAIITTAFKQRAPGMSVDRIPVFVWAQIVASFMAIFAMPAIMLSSTLLALDRMTHVSTQVFNPAEGGDVLLWQHLFWFFAHPEVYIVFLPATGFVSAILPVFARRRIVGHTAMVLALVATGFLAFGVWVHHMFATPLPTWDQGLFTTSSLAIVIPGGTQVFCWLATLWGGRIRLRAPMLFALGFLPLLVLGGLTGVMVASSALDRQVHDTFFIVAHLHYVLVGGAVFPLFAALYYWFPKWTGRRLGETLGAWNFWLMFAGFNLTFFPMHQLGLEGMPRRVYTYLPETGWGPLNLLATTGAGVLALGILLFFVNVAVSRRRGEPAGDDPWEADSLEWATSSPPPPWNFGRLPSVRGRAPLWEGLEGLPQVTGLDPRHREVLVTTMHEAAPDHRYHISGESPWPFVTALVVGGGFMGVVVYPQAAIVALVLVALALTGWFWPSHEPEPIPPAGIAREGA